MYASNASSFAVRLEMSRVWLGAWAEPSLSFTPHDFDRSGGAAPGGRVGAEVDIGGGLEGFSSTCREGGASATDGAVHGICGGGLRVSIDRISLPANPDPPQREDGARFVPSIAAPDVVSKASAIDAANDLPSDSLPLNLSCESCNVIPGLVAGAAPARVLTGKVAKRPPEVLDMSVNPADRVFIPKSSIDCCGCCSTYCDGGWE